MNPKTVKIAYLVATILFALWLVADGIGGIIRAEAGQESLAHLGYPMYLLVLSGIAKLLAAVAIVQNKFYTVKEWAFAGYAFTCFLAFGSHIAVGDSFGSSIFPLVFLAIMCIPYVLWKKVRALPHAPKAA